LSVINTIQDKGWRQFSIIRRDAHDKLDEKYHFDNLDEEYLLIVTQDCDLLTASLAAEPFFEVIPMMPCESNRYNESLNGKVARRLKISLTAMKDIESSGYILFANKRFYIDRNILTEIDPIEVIADENNKVIRRWLSKRYSRVAFPNNFDKCFSKKALKSIKKTLSNFKEAHSILISLNTLDELPVGQDYKITVAVMIKHQAYSHAPTYSKYNAIVDTLERQLNTLEGIDSEVLLYSDADMSVSEYTEFLEWDFDYLSYEDDSLHTPPLGI